MVRVLVVYESKYGNTRQVAEEIAAGIVDAEGEATVSHVGEVDPARLADYDAILIGSPNHLGRPVGSAKRFIDGLARPELEGKTVSAFDTCLGRDLGKTVGRMEKSIGEKAGHLRIFSPGLSIRVGGIKGPIVDGELAKCRQFGASLAGSLKKDG